MMIKRNEAAVRTELSSFDDAYNDCLQLLDSLWLMFHSSAVDWDDISLEEVREESSEDIVVREVIPWFGRVISRI